VDRTGGAKRNSEMAEWLQQIREGSVSAFDRFYERAAPMLMPIACQMLGDRMEAEDVCHDVMMQVITHPERYDPARGSVEAWLLVATKSRCLDRLRRRKRMVLQDAPDAERTPAVRVPLPEETVLAKMEGEAVRLALRQLPASQRKALAAAFYSLRSQRELAEAWQVPLGTVKSRVRYGLNHMRRALLRLGWAEAEGGEPHG